MSISARRSVKSQERQPLGDLDSDERAQHISERARRWRLALGASDDLKQRAREKHQPKIPRAWSSKDAQLDQLFSQLYGRGRRGLEVNSSYPTQLFKRLSPRALDALDALDRALPNEVSALIRDDITQRLDASAILRAHDEGAELKVSYAMLEHLVSQSAQLTDQERERARVLVAPLIRELESLFKQRIQESFGDELSSESAPSLTQYVPPREVDWSKTILANLKHYQPREGCLIPERIIRRQRRGRLDADLIICLDHSGSMASSVVHASIYAAALSQVPGLHTRVVMFNHEVCDLSASEADPLDIIFASRPYGGTDVLKALRYCHSLIERPDKTTLIFISDLIDSTPLASLLRETSKVMQLGAQALFLLALSDEGHPMFSDEAANALAGIGAPALYCTPERFPELLRGTLKRGAS